MAATIEQNALGLLKAFENAGKPVSRVTIEGRKIELVLSAPTTELLPNCWTLSGVT